MLTFENPFKYPRGFFYKILRETYSELVKTSPKYWKPESVKWKAFDDNVFDNPDTVGKYVFVTQNNGTPVGFASYNPATGEVGQNCVSPQFRSKGFGKIQIEKVLEILKARGVEKAHVITSELPFFVAAQKNYLALGFKEVSRQPGGPDPRYKLIKYERELLEA